MGNKLTPEQKILYQRIDTILWEQWDPIGVNHIPEARDEYYPYLSEVFLLAQEKENEARIAEYLLQVETDKMGLSGNPENCLRVARLIQEIN